jgi:glutamyl-tRNA reductase
VGRASPLVLLDLAVPRDVEPEAGDLPGVTLFDVGALRDRGSAEEDEAVERARGIVGEEVRRFVLRRRGDELSPVIRGIRRRGDAVLESELARHASRLADLTPDEIAAVEALARGIVAKLLHDPVVALKERSEPGSERTHAALLVDLLGLDPSLLDGE